MIHTQMNSDRLRLRMLSFSNLQIARTLRLEHLLYEISTVLMLFAKYSYELYVDSIICTVLFGLQLFVTPLMV